VKFCRTKFLTTIWFFALLLNVFPVANFAANSGNQAETVYCPLTKKLQPVKAAKKEVWQNPLGNICAVEAEKKSFADELFGNNLLKANSLNQDKFENLVFDFFQKGKAAFAGLPQFPDLPHKNSVKTSFVVIVSSKTNEAQLVWKIQTADFSFSQNPRPPNEISANLFESQVFFELKKVSRQIAPRAPPFSL
jgi:hypothetical protein